MVGKKGKGGKNGGGGIDEGCDGGGTFMFTGGNLGGVISFMSDITCSIGILKGGGGILF